MRTLGDDCPLDMDVVLRFGSRRLLVSKPTDTAIQRQERVTKRLDLRAGCGRSEKNMKRWKGWKGSRSTRKCVLVLYLVLAPNRSQIAAKSQDDCRPGWARRRRSEHAISSILRAQDGILQRVSRPASHPGKALDEVAVRYSAHMLEHTWDAWECVCLRHQ